MILSENRIVVIGTSAGGVEALIRLAQDLPPDFPAPIAVVLHVAPDSPSMLAEILGRKGRLPAKTAAAGEHFQPGTIYVAQPDRHLLVRRNGALTMHVARGPRENRHRPSIDPLFRSAALIGRENAIGVILTGTLDDGTSGLMAIKQCGGIAIVQDPQDALYPSMPRSAIENAEVDHIVPIAELGALLGRLIHEPRPANAVPAPAPPNLSREVNMAEYSPESMLGAQDEQLEEALWSAVKTLEESARLSHRLAAGERERGPEWLVRRFEEKEKETRERVEVIRRYLLRADVMRASGA